MLARKAGAVFFECFLLLVDLPVCVKAGPRLRRKRADVADENFSRFLLEFLVSVVCQMNSELPVRPESVFLADEALELVSGQLTKLHVPCQRLLLDESLLTDPTPEAGMLAAHVIGKRLHGPEQLLAVTAFCVLHDVLHPNVVDSPVSARESLAAAGDHSSVVRVSHLVVNAQAREGIEIGFTNLTFDFAMFLHHFVDFSMNIRFFTAQRLLIIDILIRFSHSVSSSLILWFRARLFVETRKAN